MTALPRRARLAPLSSIAPFFNDVALCHGPRGMLRKLLETADAAARQRGVFLTFATLEELVQINRSNSDTWRPLLPIFDPVCGRFDATKAFCILGRNASSDVVVTQAARFFNWQDSSFQDEATSLRLFYHDPVTCRHRGEAVSVTAPSARTIKGRVAFTGAHWCRPDFRAQGLPAITPRIARALALTWWNVEYTCTFMAKDVFSRGVASKAGYPNAEWGVYLNNTPVGTLLAALLWTDRRLLIADLETFLARSLGSGGSTV